MESPHAIKYMLSDILTYYQIYVSMQSFQLTFYFSFFFFGHSNLENTWRKSAVESFSFEISWEVQSWPYNFIELLYNLEDSNWFIIILLKLWSKWHPECLILRNKEVRKYNINGSNKINKIFSRYRNEQLWLESKVLIPIIHIISREKKLDSIHSVSFQLRRKKESKLNIWNNWMKIFFFKFKVKLSDNKGNSVICI